MEADKNRLFIVLFVCLAIFILLFIPLNAVGLFDDTFLFANATFNFSQFIRQGGNAILNNLIVTNLTANYTTVINLTAINIEINESLELTGNLDVYGNATFNGSFETICLHCEDGDVYFHGDGYFSGNVTAPNIEIMESLIVHGNSTCTGTANACNDVIFVGNPTLCGYTIYTGQRGCYWRWWTGDCVGTATPCNEMSTAICEEQHTCILSSSDGFTFDADGFNISGSVNAYDYFINNTSIYDIFVDEGGDTMTGDLNTTGNIWIDSDTAKYKIGTANTLSIKAGIYTGTADNIEIASSKSALGTIFQSSATNFRIVANSVAGQGYFQVGANGGSNYGNLYFSGFNANRANAVTFFSKYTKFSDSGLSVATKQGTTFDGNVYMEDTLNVTGRTDINNDAYVSGDLDVDSGNISLDISNERYIYADPLGINMEIGATSTAGGSITLQAGDGGNILLNAPFMTYVNSQYLEMAGSTNLGAGTSTGGTAPLYFDNGTLMSTPETGAMEFEDIPYFTTYATRRQMLLSNTEDGIQDGRVSYGLTDTLTDSSHLNYIASLNTLTSDKFGVYGTFESEYGTALNFSSADSSVVSLTHSTDQWFSAGGSLVAWIYPRTGFLNGGRIMDKSFNSLGANDGFYWAILSAGNDVVFRIDLGTSVYASSGLNLDQWNFVAVTFYQNGSTQHYHDGVDVGSGQTTSTSGIYTTNPLTIGNRASFLDRGFDGYIDEVLMFDRVLSTAELDALYNTGTGVRGNLTSAPWNNGLIGGYHFDEFAGVVADDFSTSANNGAISNANYVTGKVLLGTAEENLIIGYDNRSIKIESDTIIDGTLYLADTHHSIMGSGNNIDYEAPDTGIHQFYNSSGLGTLRAGAYLTSTSVYDERKDGNPLDHLVNPQKLLIEGGFNYTNFYGYRECIVVDYSRPVEVINRERICSIKECSFMNVTTVIYPYNKTEPCVNVGKEMSLLSASLYKYKTAVNVIDISEDEKALDTEIIFAEEIYTKSRVPRPDIDYCKMINDVDIYSKEGHYATVERGGKSVLDTEYRMIVLEGCEKQRLREMCEMSRDAYSWC